MFKILAILFVTTLSIQISALSPLLNKYKVELSELSITDLKETLKADNAKVRLLNTNYCFYWNGFAKNSRNSRISYSIDLVDCDKIAAYDEKGHFKFDMKRNINTNLYNTFVHSQVGKDQGCFGSSLQNSIVKKKQETEEINEFLYMRYCPTTKWPDVSTRWGLRPAKYVEMVETSAKPTNYKDKSSDKTWRYLHKSSTNLVSDSYVYRLENIVEIDGEQNHFCISKNGENQLKLKECGSMNPNVDQWFEIIEEEYNI